MTSAGLSTTAMAAGTSADGHAAGRAAAAAPENACPGAAWHSGAAAVLPHFLPAALSGAFCPDIEIVAFERVYPLHRLLLAQAPFFRELFTGGWSENEAVRARAPGASSGAASRRSMTAPR